MSIVTNSVTIRGAFNGRDARDVSAPMTQRV